MTKFKLPKVTKNFRNFFAAVGVLSGILIVDTGKASDIYSRIDACESSGDQSCIFSLFREIAGKIEAGGGGNQSSKAFMTYSCNDQTSQLDISTRNAQTGQTFTYSHSFARYRFSCVASLLEDLSQVLTIVNQRKVSACDPRSLMVISFSLSPVAPANLLFMSNQFQTLAECKQEALRLNQVR